MTDREAWISCELHAHTLHSDGGLTLEALARAVADRGVEVVALTDHNTNAGHREIPGAERASGVTILPGMELTTFYGHVAALGTESYIEWRTLTRDGINPVLDAIHEAGALVGVNHPFHPGSPFCTGCFWEFEGLDWRRVDSLEVWSEPDPWERPKNDRALRLWEELLDGGHRVTAVSGTDLHAPQPSRLSAVTYLGTRGARPGHDGAVAALTEALRRGRAMVTLGPLLTLSARIPAGEGPWGPGEGVPRRAAGARLAVDVAWTRDGRARLWEPSVEVRAVELRGNTGVIARQDAGDVTGAATFSVDREGLRWFRADLRGRARGQDALIAFTNPVYLEE